MNESSENSVDNDVKVEISESEAKCQNEDNNSFKTPIFLPKVHKHNITASEQNEDNLTQQEFNDFQTSEENRTNTPPVPYQEPPWSGLPVSKSCDYEFEVLKSGIIIETINLMKKNFWIFGRLPNCDISMAHPTISRYHAVFQYNEKETTDRPIGFYIYDLGSTHGTFLNKSKIKPNMYVRVQVGHMLKLGNSTRNFILQGPPYDSEPESEMSITELKKKRTEEIKSREAEQMMNEAETSTKTENKVEKSDTGIDWGMGEDADEETDLSENPYAVTNNEELYINDPKKTLRGFFERQGCELEYDVEEKSIGHFICRVELPVDDIRGKPIIAEAIVKGKKKEAVLQCALEGCRILDRIGVLRQANQESRKRKAKNWEENDFYDSDDDEFLDRTGDIQKKRERKMKMFGKLKPVIETYDSLIKREETLLEEINTIENDIIKYSAAANTSANNELEDIDSLDSYMSNLKNNKPDKFLVHDLKRRLTNMKQEHTNLQKLINIAKPASLPPVKKEEDKTQKAAHKFPLFGKRLKSKPLFTAKPEKKIVTVESETNVEEFDEEQEIVESSKNVRIEPEKESSKSKEDVKINEDESLNKVNLKEEVNLKKTDVKKPSENKNVSDKKNKKRKKEQEMSSAYKQDENYSMWVPPDDQQGDGKTKLNEKFGY